MKNQALFSLKDKSKKLKCRLLQFLFGVLRVKVINGAVFQDSQLRDLPRLRLTAKIMVMDQLTLPTGQQHRENMQYISCVKRKTSHKPHTWHRFSRLPQSLTLPK